MKYQIINDPENIDIVVFDSYLVKDDAEKTKILEEIMADPAYAEMPRTRSLKSYLKEWKAHNTLYNWGWFKDRTQNVNLDEKDGETNIIWSILAWFE